MYRNPYVFIHICIYVCACVLIYVGVCMWPLTPHPVLGARLLLLTTTLRVHVVYVYVHTCINTCECVRVSVCVGICATSYARCSFDCYCIEQGIYTPGTLLFFKKNKLHAPYFIFILNTLHALCIECIYIPKKKIVEVVYCMECIYTRIINCSNTYIHVDIEICGCACVYHTVFGTVLSYDNLAILLLLVEFGGKLYF